MGLFCECNSQKSRNLWFRRCSNPKNNDNPNEVNKKKLAMGLFCECNSQNSRNLWFRRCSNPKNNDNPNEVNKKKLAMGFEPTTS